MTTIKITELTDIGANLASSTVLPVVNMSGTPTTQKTILGNIANVILGNAGGNYVAVGAATLAGTVTTNAQPNITSTGSLTGLTVSNAAGTVNFSNTANVTLGDVGNLHIAGGTAGQLLSTNGNGTLSWASDTTTYGNSNVVSLMASFGSNTITTTGNVSVGNIIGNGQALTNIAGANVSGTVGNANLSQYLNVSDVNNNFSYHVVLSAGSGDKSLHIDADDNLQYNPADGTLTATRVDATYVLADLQYSNGYPAANVTGLGNIATINLTGSTSNVLYGNGVFAPASGGGGGNTGNVTFDNQIVIGTGGNDGTGGLYLAAGPDGVANTQYLRVRGGDNFSHIHLDTSNSQAYDQYFGNDAKYVKLELGDAGNVVIGTDDATGNLYNWTFTSDGNLILANGNSVIQSIANSSLDPVNPNVSTMVLTPDPGYSTQSLVLDPTAPGHIHLRSPGANIDEPYANIFLGGEDSSFEVGYYNGAAPNLFIHSNTNTWTFENTGNLNFPAGGNLNFNIGGITQVINQDLEIVVQDEEDDGWSLLNTITDSLGNNLSRTTLDSGSFTITTDITGTNHSWGFEGNTLQVSNDSQIRSFGSNVVVQSMSSGSGGTASLQSVSNTNDPNIFTTFDATTTGANISVYNGGSNGGVGYTWQFANDGKLTFPGTPRIDTSTNNFEVQAAEAINFEANAVVNIYTDAGNNAFQWQFGDDGNLTLPGDIIGTANANFTIYSNAAAHEFIFGDDGTFYAPDNVVLGGTSIYIGPGANTLTGIEHEVFIASSNNFAYVQAVVNNVSDNGSADWVALGAKGDDTGGQASLGFTSSGFGDANYSITGNGDGYVFVQSYGPGQTLLGGGGNLVLTTGNQGTTKDIIFGTGGFLSSNIFGRISHANNSLELSRTGATITFPDATEQNTAWTGSVTTIANGNSNVNIATSNGNIVITSAGTNSWNFDSTGNLTIPGSSGGFIKTVANASIGVAAVDNGTNNPAQLLSMTNAGAATSIISAYATNATIQTNATGTLNTWQFDNAGNLTLPTSGHIIVSGGLVSSGASPAPTINGFSITNSVGISGNGNIAGNNISATGNVTAQGVGTNMVRRANTISGSNTAVTLDNLNAYVGGTPKRLYIGAATSNMTMAGQSQTMSTGALAVSSWINVPIVTGTGNGFAMSGAITNDGDTAVLNVTDQGAGSGTWRVTGMIANTSANLYSVSIERLA